MAGLIQSPEKELRFTRSGQAVSFWILSAVLVAAALILGVTASNRDVNPRLPHPAWALLPLGLAAVVGKFAFSLTRHAYLILTPLGIEIFPFFRPSQGMQLVMWQEVSEAEVSDDFTLLSLHRDAEKTSGIRLSLRPIRGDRRCLLAKAVIGRLSPGSHTG